jgi:hypothetical protein
LDKKDICPDFKDDYIFHNGKKRTICGYFDLDTNALCQHDNHTVCIFYFKKHNIDDPWLRQLMEDLGLVIVKEKR